MKIILFMLAMSLPLSAQVAVYVMPPVTHSIVGGVQSVSATLTGSANKGITWTKTGAACGAFVGSGNTIGVASAATGLCTVTGTSIADGTKSATSAITFDAVRTDLQASSTHPRIMLTGAEVTAMQTKAASGAGNVVYTQGIAAFFATRQTYFNANFCFTGGGCGTVGPKGTIDTTTGWISGDTSNGFTATAGGPYEEDTQLYALMALIDPTVGNRTTWAARARDLSMWEMNEICYNAFSGTGACIARNYSGLGGNSNQAFVGSQFILNNRAQTNTLPELRAIDWNYASFSAADKTIINQVFHIWGAQLTGAYIYDVTDGTGEHVNPIGSYNTSAIISTAKWKGESGSNNYAEGHFMELAALGVLLDPADDIAISSCASSTTTICATDGTAKMVSAYGVYAVKGWLYRNYANFEDAHIVNNQLGLTDPFLCPDVAQGTTPCTGNMSGGFSGEGTGYGALSLTEMWQAVYTLYTAGKLDPSVDVQSAFISSAFWDKVAVSFVDQLLPNQTGANGGKYTAFANDSSYGVYTQPGIFFNELEPYDALYGSSFREQLDRWYQYNVLYGGYSNYFGRFMGSAPRNGGNITLMSPNVVNSTSATNDSDFGGGPAPIQNKYDPRTVANFPLDFENESSQGGFYRYYGRTDYTITSNQFQFGCHTAVTSHAMPACGRFDFIRKGEQLTTALGGSSNSDPYAQAPQHQNIPGYQWNETFSCANAGSASGICTQGGMVDQNQALYSSIVLNHSSNALYYWGQTDSSGAYSTSQNTCQWCSAAANVNLSQRDALWIKPDMIFIYDRAETTSSTSFKNWNINLPVTPTIAGNVATMTSATGQKLFVTSLLPGTMTSPALDSSHESAPPVTKLLLDTAPTTASVRMLHILEGKDTGTATAATLVQSSAGLLFDGGVIGTTVAMFKRTLATTFTSMTYPASGGTTHYVGGLTPNTAYPITGTGAPATATTDSGGLLTFAATGTGNLTIGTAGAATSYVINLNMFIGAGTIFQ